MNKDKPQKLTSYKNKITGFIIFFSILSLITFLFTYSLLHIDMGTNTSSGTYIDGTDFSPIVNIFAFGFESIITLVFGAFSFVINTVIILIATLIFQSKYFKTMCVEQTKLKQTVKTIILGASSAGLLINIALGINTAGAVIFALIIYTPLLAIVYPIVISKFEDSKIKN